MREHASSGFAPHGPSAPVARIDGPMMRTAGGEDRLFLDGHERNHVGQVKWLVFRADLNHAATVQGHSLHRSMGRGESTPSLLGENQHQLAKGKFFRKLYWHSKP